MHKIISLDTIDSTNTFALKNINDFKDKQIITAKKQSSGKGRFARKWISDVEGNIYMSIILKPSSELNTDMPFANITQYMSVALCKTLEKYGINPEIKWPNDVLVEGKKISGILCELSTQGKSLKGVVLGIGVNLNLTPDHLKSIDQPATALNLLLNKPISRDTFIEELLDEFFGNYDYFWANGFKSIKPDYIKRSSYLGKQVTINSLSSKESGIAKSINEDGSLLFVDSDMSEKTINAGDLVF